MLYRYKLEQDSSESEESAEEGCSSPPSKVAKVQTTPKKHEAKRVAQSTMNKEEDDPYGGSTDEEEEPKPIQKPGKLLMSCLEPQELCCTGPHYTVCAHVCVQWVYVGMYVRMYVIKVTHSPKRIAVIPVYE